MYEFGNRSSCPTIVGRSGSLLGWFVSAFFTDLFLDLAPPFVRQPRAKKAIQQISEKQDRRHPLIIHRRKNQHEEYDQETRDGLFGLSIDGLETRILEPAEHHERKKDQQRWQNELPFAELMFALSQPEQEQRDRCNQTRGGRNRKPGKIFVGVISRMFLGACGGVEARQPKRTAEKIDKGNDPAGSTKFLEHTAVDQQRWRDAERNDVGQRIELATECAFVPAKARQTPIQKIENERAQNKPDRLVKKIGRRVGVAALQERALQNFERCSEPTEQIPRRHQVRQQINLRRLFVHDSGRRAIIVDPPATCSPTFTNTSAARGKYTSVRDPKRIIPKRSPLLTSSPTSDQATIRRAIAPVSCLTTIVTRSFSNAQVVASFFSEQ